VGIRYRQASPNGDGGALLTNVSSCTVLSISPMRVSEAWRLGAVWDREVLDGGYGRSRARKERWWIEDILGLTDVGIDFVKAVNDSFPCSSKLR